ncbi:MAG: hypothetical protein QXY47_07475, partial [Thermoplasmata archaeon]
VQYSFKNKFNHVLTITYYKTTNTVLIQGKSNRLYDDTILWFSDRIYQKPVEIVQIIIGTIEDFEKYKISFDEDLIDSELQRIVGNVYNNSKILHLPEKKWLKTSFILINFDIELPEYYPAIAGSLKVIEGFLRRSLIQKVGFQSFKKTGAFDHFDPGDKAEIFSLVKEENLSLSSFSILSICSRESLKNFLFKSQT